MFPEDSLTRDGFLGGRLTIMQPRDGYRAATDPVLLAAAVPARAGQSVLELGCGAGVAALCLLWRVPGAAATGVERQAAYAALARRNADLNALPLAVEEADLARLPPALRARDFDHVLANPPYFPAGGGTPARDPGREAAQREETPLDLWCDAGLRRLRPGGSFTLIQLAERLPDLLRALSGRGSVCVLPVVPRAGRPAGRVIVQVIKGGRAPFRLLSPLVVHAGETHRADADDYSPEARAILRDGVPLLLGK